MPTVQMIEEEQATGLVKEIYDDFKATRGVPHVPNFWKTLATHPPTLARVWRDLKEVMAPGRLDPLTKEMLAIAVSATNGCSYCVNSHTAAVRKLGASAEMLGEVLAIAGLFNMTNALADGYRVEPDVLPDIDAAT